MLANARYDANANGEMWVRAEGEITEKVGSAWVPKKRVVVARVRVEQLPLSPPKAPFVAGKFNTGNNAGNKVIVQTNNGVYGVVRCDNTGGVTDHTNDCIDYGNGQLTPDQHGQVRHQRRLGDRAGADGRAQADGDQQRHLLRQRVPDRPERRRRLGRERQLQLPGQHGRQRHDEEGHLHRQQRHDRAGGQRHWWGVLYALNAQNCGPTTTGCLTYKGYSDNVVTVTGTPTVHGAIFVDGDGRLGIGNSGNSGNCANCLPNLMYDPSVVLDITAYGTAGIIQNTWREIYAPAKAACSRCR